MGTRSSFVSHTATRIQIEGDDRWIDIKPKLGQGDRLDLVDSLLEMKALQTTKTSKGASITTVAKYGAFVNALLSLSITDWYLTDEAGTPVPFAVERIADLDPDDLLTEKVTQEVVERNPLGVRKAIGGIA